MAVPFPYPENITGITGLIAHANNLTSGFFGIGILLAITAIAFIITYSFGYAGFLSLLVAILLRAMNLINDSVLYLVIVSFIIIVLYLWYKKEHEEI